MRESEFNSIEVHLTYIKVNSKKLFKVSVTFNIYFHLIF